MQAHVASFHTRDLKELAGFAHPHANIKEFGLGPGMKIADFGAGSGHYALAMAEAVGKSGTIYAIDVQKDLLRKLSNEAQRRGLDKQLEIVWGDVEAVQGSKIADSTVDMALLSNVLFQLPDKPAALKEAARILKPEGRLVAIEWDRSKTTLGPRGKDAVSREELGSLARIAGFDFVRAFHAGSHHYGAVFSKARILGS